MKPNWLRQVARSLTRPVSPVPYVRRRRPALALKEFEDRIVPAENAWLGSTTSVHWGASTSNWSLGHFPLPSETVMIPDTANASRITILLDATDGPVTIAGLTSYEHITLLGTGGSLTVNGDVTISGNLSISATTGVSSFTTTGAVYINDFYSNNTSTTTTAATLTVGTGGVFTGGAATTVNLQNTNLTLGGNGQFTTPGDVNVGRILSMSTGNFLSTGSLSVSAVGSAVFDGPTEVHGNLTTAGSTTVTSTLTVTGDAAFNATNTVLLISGASAVLDVAGKLTTGNANINIGGGGTLKNATVQSGKTINQSGVGGMVFDGVTIPAGTTISLNLSSESATIRNGMKLDGVIDVQALGTPAGGIYPTLALDGTQTISSPGGTGIIQAGTNTGSSGTSGTALVQAQVQLSSGSTATFGPGLTFRGGRVNVSGDPTTAIDNKGTIEYSVAQTVTGSLGFNLSVGTLSNATGATIRMSAGLGTNPTMTLNSSTFNGQGTISVLNGTLNFNGNSTSLGVLANTGGTLRFSGTLDNTGKTLALDDTTGSLTLTGTIIGGTITTAGSARLICSNATLNGVTLAGTISGTAYITNGLTLNNATASSATLTFLGPTSGSGAQTLGGTSSFAATLLQSTTAGVVQTVTIGPGVTITGGSIGTTNADQKWVLLGKVSADTANVNVNATEFVNTGTIEVLNGRTLTVTVGAGWVNTNGISINPSPAAALPTSILSFAGTFLESQIGPVYRNGGTRRIVGTLLNAEQTFVVDDSTGPWQLAGTIQGGTVAQSGAATLSNSGTVNILDGVTLSGTFTGSARVKTGLTLAGGSITGGLRFLSDDSVGAAQLLGGTGTVQGGITQTVTTNIQTVTIGPNVTILNTGFTTATGSATLVKYVLQGTLTSNSGTTYAPQNGDLVIANGSIVTVDNGATLSMGSGASSGTWNNQGEIRINSLTPNNTATTLVLAGQFTPANIGTVTRAGGLVIIDGTMTNAGTFVASVGGGAVQVRNGTVNGGRIEAASGFLSFAGGTATLNGVTLAGPATIANSLQIQNGLTLDTATLTLSAATTLNFLATGTTQTLGGTGSILSTNGSTLTLLNASSSQTVVVGPNITLSGYVINFGLSGATSQKWVLQGTLRANLGNVNIYDDVSNTGLIEVLSSRVLTYAGTMSSPNLGTVTLASGATANSTATFTNGVTLTPRVHAR